VVTTLGGRQSSSGGPISIIGIQRSPWVEDEDADNPYRLILRNRENVLKQKYGVE